MQGSTDAVFSFDSLPAGVCVVPQKGCVRVGGSIELTVELTLLAEQSFEKVILPDSAAPM